MRARTSIALVALAVLLLSGCLPQPSTVTPSPEASSTPVFASDEEALAAATAAYAAYSAMSDQIAADGGADPERMKPLTTTEWFEKDLKQFDEFAETGNRLSGTTTFNSIALQSLDDEMLALYLCVDVSATRILDSNGGDVTPAGRPERVPLEVGFDLSKAPGELLLASSQVWNGESFCIG
ncbi:MAG: hypothetical protein ACOH10_04545 [Rhodoglobus sp.]